MGSPSAGVTGVGCLCAAGGDLDSCLGSMFRGERRLGLPTRFSTSHPVPFPVFEIPGSSLPSAPGSLPLTARLSVAAARQALADAGLDLSAADPERVGVCVGTTVGAAMNDEPFYAAFRKGDRPPLDPICRYLGGNPSEAVARAVGARGPLQTVVNACSSGTDAIGVGLSWIRAGVCDAVLAGGADELCRMTVNGFASLQILNRGPCAPFDRDRAGLNLGEGAAILVLESAAFRERRGGRLRAEVLGYGLSADGHHPTAPHPEGAGLRRALARALAESGKRPGEIAFVNAHGTGTEENDRVEGRVLADLLPGVPFHSTKGFTGHALGAAGGIEAAFTVAFLERGRIPASAGFVRPDPGIGACPVAAATEVRGDAAISQSLAFGGNNSVLVLGRARGGAR